MRRGTPRPVRLGQLVELHELPGDLVRGPWRVCPVCAGSLRVLGGRADRCTCSDRCRTARRRGVALLGLALVHETHRGCGGVAVWTYRPASGPGVVTCTRCGGVAYAWPRPRPWEPRAEDDETITDADLAAFAAAGELPPDEDEAVTGDTAAAGAA